MSKISIIIPVFHNALSLPALLKELQRVALNNNQYIFEFVFVDDHSEDDSFNVLKKLSETEHRMKVIRLSRNFGSNSAILAGLTNATGDALAMITADLQDPPEVITQMLEKWQAGSKVVIATRKGRKDPILTIAFARIFYALFRKFAISSMPPKGFDTFLIDRCVCNILTQIKENNAYLMGLILWLGFNREIVYYQRLPRDKSYGKSRWTLWKKIKYSLDAFTGFSYAPLRATSLLGILFSIAGFIYAAAIIFMKFSMNYDVPGWTSLMVVLLLVSGTQMLMLGIFGEYLWRTLEASRRRPMYIIEQILDQNRIDSTKKVRNAG